MYGSFFRIADPDFSGCTMVFRLISGQLLIGLRNEHDFYIGNDKYVLHLVDYKLQSTRGDSMKNLKLKVARIERDFTQADLAKQIGVTRQTIGAIEKGEYNPTIKLCVSICKALGKTLDELFWEEG